MSRAPNTSRGIRFLSIGTGLFLSVACTIETKSSDDDDDNAGDAGAGAGNEEAGSAGRSGSYSGGAGTTSTAGTAGSTSGGNGYGDGGSSGSSGGVSTGGSAGSTQVGAAGASEGGEGGSTSEDNCPDDPSTDQTDTDSDGWGDVCDDDDDDDGFVDADDPQPTDADVPGDFSTPEKVLADPRVMDALAGLEDAGFDLETHLETEPPDVTGYFRKESGTGEFVANSGGGDVGQSIVGSESRTELNERDRLETYSVSFSGSTRTSFGIVTGQILRGTGNEYTIYKTARTVCTESGSNYTTFSVAINSGTVDSATGDLVDVLNLGITIATQGELTSACASRLNGLVENEGEWSASQIPLIAKVEVSDLEFMCVDGDAAFAPTETWTRDGQACECTRDYTVACETPADP